MIRVKSWLGDRLTEGSVNNLLGEYLQDVLKVIIIMNSVSNIDPTLTLCL
ncbi:hypothetical protein NWP22_10410 [Anabaenopsis tanganyikae CS-531]|uniref:Uncharacterized protein n=2 Tax=Anabaenopsis TaxID=110103 RepID=A0ABT5AQT2_9CYAN|nr:MULTISPECIES: hypothetical protein [Anabaenopsis]MDB9539629.1 hypothetical protein [Anabaenopsis arnoldii]MDH6091934.1 hypothetical protein [Anabaenopsis arnoldii]MDH6106272.1 hypothetical protein [Anabaenopsis tanganyikae CS-531]